MPGFERYIGIDYSGAGAPDSRQPGLRAFEGSASSPPSQVRGTSGRNWSRRELARWLEAQLRRPERTIVGIDHGFSFPLAYMRRHGLASWDAFLDDFVQHWPTDERVVESLRSGSVRAGTSDELRLCETWVAGPKSVFLFDVQGAVAKSTHAGLPWLRSLRRTGMGPFCWPFDGWEPAAGKSVVAEVYPSLFRRRYPRVEGETDDEHDARCICTWLRERDAMGFLDSYFEPPLSVAERAIAELEGWILGVA